MGDEKHQTAVSVEKVFYNKNCGFMTLNLFYYTIRGGGGMGYKIV